MEREWAHAVSSIGHALLQVPQFTPEATKVLETLCEDQFSMEAAQRVKEVERTTNHDVKAVEYVLRETMQTNEELTKARSADTAP